MKRLPWYIALWPLLVALASFPAPAWADTHIYAGALGTVQGDKLSFSNASLFDATQGGAPLPQVLRTNGLNKGYYRGDALTFSALAATSENGGPAAGHAAFGARLAVQVVSVDGPEGGSFAFWEGDGESDLGAITFRVPVGTVAGTNAFLISENAGAPGADPYGHVHGREFSTSHAGIYTVGFQVIDLSSNGTDGGPIHRPSDVLKVRFQAGLYLDPPKHLVDGVTVSFRSPPGIVTQVELAEAADLTNWQAVGTPLRGNNNLQKVTDTNSPSAGRFYRLRQLNNLP